ncbi:hypothetical protein [Pseudoflavonifractor sp. MSJ-37]|uniref:hypothetical protein n=1 Tax=Pseudoflavonifractor sp. MSJ-37 TaxID=2841531 RepID=UPI001C0F6697|nr:hypothetical protein [Pseudoflavonifractor sp. MSJ-37]MBU5434483.1 hypothetical protein [Pseudoflavonifractor sp. MSJ-37]
MKRTLSLALALLSCLILLVVPASADMGPKPDLTITVVNAPEGTFYLDLMVPEEEHGSYDNLRDEDYDPDLLTGLRQWEGEGWYPAFSGGTDVPLFGDITPREDGTFYFTYFGLPDTFRIGVSAAEGAKLSDQTIRRTTFYSHVTYDWATNEAVLTSSVWKAGLAELAATLIPTLLAEGILLALFGFAGERRNWIVFLLTNLATQIGLHAVFAWMGGNWVTFSSSFVFYLAVMALPELVILVVETMVYAGLLEGRSRARRTAYAVTANLASFALSFLPLGLLQQVLRTL